MKLNLSRIVLAAGLSLGIISFASIAEAGLELNGSSLKGQVSPTFPQKPFQQLKKLSGNGSSLRGQVPQSTTKKPSQQAKGVKMNASSLKGQSSEQLQLSQQLKKLSQNASSLTGQTTEPKPAQGNKGIETSP